MQLLLDYAKRIVYAVNEQMDMRQLQASMRLYALDGKQVAAAAVANGVTTVYVGQLPAGVYVLRVGNKALKFTKK